MIDFNSKQILKEIRENRAKLDSCAKHKFDLGEPPFKLASKAVCLNCGGKEALTAIGDYCKGYKAAGGNPNDIVENFE